MKIPVVYQLWRLWNLVVHEVDIEYPNQNGRFERAMGDLEELEQVKEERLEPEHRSSN